MWKYKPSSPPLTAPSLKLIQLCKSSHWNNGTQAGQWKQLANKKPSSRTDRKRSIGCTGCVMVDRVGATDEWVQEAVMSDIFHQTSKSDRNCHSRNKRTQVVHRLKTTGLVTEPKELWKRRVF